MKIIKDHVCIGMGIKVPHKGVIVDGTILVVKSGQVISATIEDGKMSLETIKVLRYKVQPDDGGKTFWTGNVLESSVLAHSADAQTI